MSFSSINGYYFLSVAIKFSENVIIQCNSFLKNSRWFKFMAHNFNTRKKYLRIHKFNSPFLLIMKLRSRNVTGLSHVNSHKWPFYTSYHITALLKVFWMPHTNSCGFLDFIDSVQISLQFLLFPWHSVLPAVTAALAVPETSCFLTFRH